MADLTTAVRDFNAAAGRLLLTLNYTGQHIYAGTVPAAEKARRRAANRVARKSRRINRKK